MKKISVEIDDDTHDFYSEIAKIVERPIGDIVKDTLEKYAEIVMRSVKMDEGS